jgi:hypothetical protein
VRESGASSLTPAAPAKPARTRAPAEKAPAKPARQRGSGRRGEIESPIIINPVARSVNVERVE